MHPQRHSNTAEPHRGATTRPNAWGPIPEQRDPLTDSGVLRLQRTRVRLHTAGGAQISVPMLDIMGVTSWDDVAGLVTSVRPFIIRGERRYAFAAGVVLWAEVIPDDV